MTAPLLDAICCPRCKKDRVFVRHGRPVCSCVTKEAIAGRKAAGQIASVIRLVDKLHEIDQRPPAGQRIEIGDGELRAPCECCSYATMNDVTFLEDAYEAAGLVR